MTTGVVMWTGDGERGEVVSECLRAMVWHSRPVDFEYRFIFMIEMREMREMREMIWDLY